MKKPRIHIALEQFPNHAAALGCLLGHWAVLEDLIAGLMQYLFKVKPTIASLIFDEFVSTKSKILLLRRVNHIITDDKSLKLEIESLLSEAQKLNSKRNSFIHSSWVSGENMLFRCEKIMPPNHQKVRKEPTIVTLQDIQNVVEEIAELSASIGDLLFRLLGEPLVRSLL